MDIKEKIKQPSEEKKKLLEKIKNSKLALVLLGSFLTLFIIFVIFLFFPLEDEQTKDKQNQESNQILEYSQDQQKVIDAFGLPETFTIINVAGLDSETTEKLLGEDFAESGDSKEVNRSEIWRYLYLGEVFLFDDGVFQAREHYDFNISEGMNLVRAIVEPKQFYGIKNIVEINQLLDAEANTISELNPEVMTDATIYSYDNLIDVGEIAGQVVFIKTNAGVAESEQLSSDQFSPDQDTTLVENSNQDQAWRTGRIFSSDQEFSVFVDIPMQDKIVLHEEILDDTSMYLYCYQSEEENEDFLCDGDGFPLFIISKYTPEAYDEFLKTPYAETELVLLETTEAVYTFSHPNGDPPAELVDQIRELYENVQNSFLLTEEMNE